MVKVALVNPPSPFLIDDKVMPPLGIMYLSSYLKEKGVKVEIFDLAVLPTGGRLPHGHDIYAFTSTTPNYPSVLEIMKRIKENNNKSIFVIGGSHATAFEEKIRDDGWDFIVVGEGERSLHTISQIVENQGEDARRKGHLISMPHIEDINTIPFPDRTFKGFDSYNYTIDGLRATTMITSRGCPFSCYFCMNMWGNNVRLRNSENVIKEASHIQNMGFDAVQFYDDTFTVSRKRLYKICNGLKELDMKWRCFIHASTVSKGDLKYMKMSGCVEVGMGVESGSDLILNTINKKIDINKAIQVCGWAHESGLRIKTFLIIGLPGESQETVNATIRFLELAKPDDFDYTVYTPFPNTKIWNEKEKFDIIFNKEKLDYSKMFYKGKSGQYCSQVSTSQLSSDSIEKLRDYVDTITRRKIHES